MAGVAAGGFTLGDDWTPYGFSASARVGAIMTMVPAQANTELGDPGHAELAG